MANSPAVFALLPSLKRAEELSTLSIISLLGQDLTEKQQVRLRRLRHTGAQRLEAARGEDGRLQAPALSAGKGRSLEQSSDSDGGAE